MSRTGKLIIGALALVLVVLAAPFFYEPLYAQTYGILKGKEVRVIDATSIKTGSWDADGGNPGHHITVNFSTNTAEFYTGQTMSTAVNFVSGSFRWMHLNLPTNPAVLPIFDNGFEATGPFIADAGTFDGNIQNVSVVATDPYFYVPSDGGNIRFEINGDTSVCWAGTGGVCDTELHREAADELKTDDAFAFGAGLSVGQQTLTGTSLTLDATDYIVLVDDDTAGSTVTITLPACASHAGRIYHVKKLGTTADVVLDGNSSETIDDALTATLTAQYEALSIVCATNWSIF